VLAVIGVILALVVVGVALASTVLGGGDNGAPARPNRVASPTAPAKGGSGAGAKAGAARTKVNRSQVTVAVLNGTTTTGLARAASDKLTKVGFQPGVVTNDTTNQARSATAVFYTPGNRRAALDVAMVIGEGADAVQPIDDGTRLIAGQGADVVVTVGADQAQ
jgi:hypothetical protein